MINKGKKNAFNYHRTMIEKYTHTQRKQHILQLTLIGTNKYTGH